MGVAAVWLQVVVIDLVLNCGAWGNGSIVSGFQRSEWVG